ncbi:OmpA family protein [Oleomonas cavernae]|uniref:OmpA family protein n=1 Tax=Oleomonas cavernae TaxID=2320859 RepID=A0A418WBC1_9PROT|nr:outer membrane beta-barrel protein [Oleomonas cavernae]RJF87322.1 OmpA family protein [Oleomonas cavernae]
MRITLGLVSAAALMVAASAAHADRVGPYLSAFGGYVIQPDLEISSGGADGELSTDNGWAAGGAMGYDFGRPRVEAEVTYRRNEADEISSGGATVDVDGNLSSLAVMINALYDFENSSRFTPYIGAGIGAAWVYANDIGVPGARVDDDDVVFAYQGIAGVKVAVTGGLSLFVDYRYFATLDPEFDAPGGGTIESEYATHNIMAGLTYNFGTGAAPMAEPAPAAAPAPAPADARSYIVFFDWNSTAITPEAQAIIQDAANAASSLGVARIELTGHADRSGSAAYNQGLSLKRAKAVATVLVGLGIPAANITTVGKGESAPLVPTPDGVREPQNRRVEIVM